MTAQSRKIQWAGQVVIMGEAKNVYRILMGKYLVKRT